MLSGAVVVLTTSFLLYRLATSELKRNRLPTNASALEIEEAGKNADILELARAHLRYKLKGKVDLPLVNPGENPYTLPPPPDQVDWTTLSSSLLTQLEPNLVAESFRFTAERSFYVLTENDAFDLTKNRQWVVHSTIEQRNDLALCRLFDSHFDGRENQSAYTFVVCLKSDERRDEIVKTAQGLSIRIITERSMIDKSLDFSEYAASIVRRFEQRKVPGAEYTLKECFVQPKVYEVVPDTRNGMPSAHLKPHSTPDELLPILRDWSRNTSPEHLAIVGEYGQGKSTALLAYCAEWAHAWRRGNRNQRVPLLIELRGKSPKRQTPDRFLAEWGSRYGLRGEALLSLIQSGRAVLIFEGFDEVQEAGMRFDRFEQFKALWAFSYPEAKIIFTGRPNFFLDTTEREHLLKSSPAAKDAGLDCSKILSLSFLDLPSINEALREYPLAIREEIMVQCALDSTFLDIAKRPSMLPVLGNQWDYIKISINSEEGVTSAAIIQHFIDFLYKRKESDRDRLGEFQLLHREVRHYFTQRVVWSMAKSKLRNTIDKGKFAATIEEAYDDIDAEFRLNDAENLDEREAASSVALLKEKFRNRPRPELIAAVVTDVRTHGLFVQDPAGGKDNFYLPHKQYYEVLIAETVAKWTKRKNQSWAGQLPRSEVCEIMTEEPLSIFFAAGLLTTEEAKSIKIKPSIDGKISRYFNNGTILLLGAVEVIRKILFRENEEILHLEKMKVYENTPLRYKYLAFIGHKFFKLNTHARFTAFSISMIFILYTIINIVIKFKINIYIQLLDINTEDVLTAVYPYISSVLYVFMTIVTARYIYRGRNLFDIEPFFLAMELYRTGRIEKVLARHGPKANAAVVFLVHASLPKGALPFSPEMVADAALILGIKETRLLVAP